MNEIKEYNGYYLAIKIERARLNNGVIKIWYDVKLNHSEELNGSIMTLWLHNITVDGKTLIDLQFISDVILNENNNGYFEIECSTHLSNKDLTTLVVECEVLLDKIETTVDAWKFKVSIPLYMANKDSIYNYFLKLNHNKKSHDNLYTLSKVISDAYRISPDLANKIWNELWEENRLLKGLQKRYFIRVIFQSLLNLIGMDCAVELFLMENYRLKLILEYDAYGNDNIVKIFCKYYISNSQYENLINLLNLYQTINNTNVTASLDDIKLCTIVYSVIEPYDNNYGQINEDYENNSEDDKIDVQRIIDFYSYIKETCYESALFYLLESYISCIKKNIITDFKNIKGCLEVLIHISFNKTIDFLILYEDQIEDDLLKKTLRTAISRHDLFYRYGFDILKDRKEWFFQKISDDYVFLGFFEKTKCRLADFEIDFLLNLMTENKWEQLQECFLLVVKNGDVCRVDSLIDFISSCVQSYKRKYTYSTKDYGLFKMEIQYSVFHGIEYKEIATISKQNMLKYKNILDKLLEEIFYDSRTAKTLGNSIRELEDRLQND